MVASTHSDRFDLNTKLRLLFHSLQGREDLRTDERLMQFLRAAHAALRPAGLSVRTFTVVPLARRTGLIQWVGNSVPLYEVYNAAQVRTATELRCPYCPQHVEYLGCRRRSGWKFPLHKSSISTPAANKPTSVRRIGAWSAPRC